MAEIPGLTSAEAAHLKAAGKSNDIDLRSSRSFADIFRANFLSLANVLLLTIIVVLVLVGKPADALVTGGAVGINIIVGTFQEFQSKRKLDQIALLTRPKVTVIRDGRPQEVSQTEVVLGDAILLRAGDQAVVDGKIISQSAGKLIDMDESLLTGESDLIPKRTGDEILSGSFAVVGEAVYVAEKVGKDSFAQKITAGAREFTLSITPLQRQISIIVRMLVMLAIGMSLLLGLSYLYQEKPLSDSVEDMAVVISLVPQGLLLMITVAYALGAVRIARKGALVQQSNAVESLSNVNVLCMDKTGTLTTNRILFHGLHPFDGLGTDGFQQLLGDYIASTGSKNRTAEAIAAAIQGTAIPPVAEVPFSSTRKWAAASFSNGSKPGTCILGAPEVLRTQVKIHDEAVFAQKLETLANQGLRVLLFAHSAHVVNPDELPEHGEASLPPNPVALGFVSFSDELRPHVRDVLDSFRAANIKLLLISGDNPDTVSALAYQAGFRPGEDRAISGIELAQLDDTAFEGAVQTHTIFGRITPEQKQRIVEVLREHGDYVAMMGDGVNDVLSLKKAQVGIAMQDGSQATRAVADIVLLGNKFEVLPDAFLEGQRILNGMNDSMRLFLTRTFFTVLLIIIAGFINTDFPFTPRHNALLTSLPVGIPALFLAYWAKTGQPQKSLLVSVTQFVFPAGFSLAVVSVFIWILYLTSGTSAEVETARSVLTTAALIGGLWIIILAEREREHWRNGDAPAYDPRRIVLALALLALFGVVMAVPGLRDFFEMKPLSWADLAIIAASMTGWSIVLMLLWRYDVLEHLLIPGYRPDKPNL
ncbi:MAG: HAD-IC family P-type ATPase [Anaerolineae bacterium]|nr:HAD-IC family P-type ATPase [Anaerolineae bacterium]